VVADGRRVSRFKRRWWLWIVTLVLACSKEELRAVHQHLLCFDEEEYNGFYWELVEDVVSRMVRAFGVAMEGDELHFHEMKKIV